jgi:hypothetical protein
MTVAVVALFRLTGRTVAGLLVVGGVETRTFVDDGNGVEPAPGVAFAARARAFGSCGEALPQLEDMPAAVTLVIVKGHL